MRRTRVFGPAYLDRVLRVDRPLLEEGRGGPVDQGADARWEPGPGLILADEAGGRIACELPEAWPGPTGTARLTRVLVPGSGPWLRAVKGLSWSDHLGGMGAGFASALDGELICPLGGQGDVLSATILDLLDRAGIVHRPLRAAGKAADWTLLVTSGPHGDKLPVGNRGALAGLDRFEPEGDDPCELVVVASLNNRLAGSALATAGHATRLLAPTSRTMRDREPSLASLAGALDLLSCNRREWEALGADREVVDAQIAVVAVTDGPSGAWVRFARPEGGRGEVRVPAFPRGRPPVDTNRAGEAFASTLVTALLDGGWSRGAVGEGLVVEAVRRATAAAALVLDRDDFGFPSPWEIDGALAEGVVP